MRRGRAAAPATEAPAAGAGSPRAGSEGVEKAEAWSLIAGSFVAALELGESVAAREATAALRSNAATPVV